MKYLWWCVSCYLIYPVDRSKTKFCALKTESLCPEDQIASALCFTYKVLCLTDQALCLTDQALCLTGQALCLTYQVLCRTYQVLCLTDQVLCLTDQVLCLEDHVFYRSFVFQQPGLHCASQIKFCALKIMYFIALLYSNSLVFMVGSISPT